MCTTTVCYSIGCFVLQVDIRFSFTQSLCFYKHPPHFLRTKIKKEFLSFSCVLIVRMRWREKVVFCSLLSIFWMDVRLPVVAKCCSSFDCFPSFTLSFGCLCHSIILPHYRLLSIYFFSSYLPFSVECAFFPTPVIAKFMVILFDAFIEFVWKILSHAFIWTCSPSCSFRVTFPSFVLLGLEVLFPSFFFWMEKAISGIRIAHTDTNISTQPGILLTSLSLRVPSFFSLVLFIFHQIVNLSISEHIAHKIYK